MGKTEFLKRISSYSHEELNDFIKNKGKKPKIVKLYEQVEDVNNKSKK
ncbi:MAG: hypothetical protein ACRCXT_10490 [Paraclostridium sp.]